MLGRVLHLVLGEDAPGGQDGGLGREPVHRRGGAQQVAGLGRGDLADAAAVRGAFVRGADPEQRVQDPEQVLGGAVVLADHIDIGVPADLVPGPPLGADAQPAVEALVVRGLLGDPLHGRHHRYHAVEAPTELVEADIALELVVREGERGVHAEVVAGPAAAGPEQFRLRGGVGGHHPAVGEHRGGGHQPVTGQSEHLVAEADTAAEHQSGHPDRRAAPGRHEHAPVLQQRMQVAVGDAGLDGHGSRIVGNVDRPVAAGTGAAARRGGGDALHPAHVEQQAGGGGVAGVVVAEAGAGHRRHPHGARPADRLADIRFGRTRHDPGGENPRVPVVEGERQRSEVGVGGPVQRCAGRERGRQPPPVPAADRFRRHCGWGLPGRGRGGPERAQRSCPQHLPPVDHGVLPSRAEWEGSFGPGREGSDPRSARSPDSPGARGLSRQ